MHGVAHGLAEGLRSLELQRADMDRGFWNDKYS